MNSVNLIGRLTKTPSLKTKDDKKWVRFDIAINSFDNNDVSYFTIVAFDKLADVVVKFLQKGSKVAIEGQLRQYRYEKDGESRNVIEIYARNIYFLDDKKTTTVNNDATQELDDLINEDNLPF